MKFVVYRVAVEQALADYRERYGGCEPSAIIAHPTVQLQAPAGVAVERNGGCLVGELWLPVPPEGDDHAR